MPMDKIFTKIGIAFGASVAVNEAVNLEPLWTALITLAVSIITVLTVEGVAWLKAWFTAKKSKLEIETDSKLDVKSDNKLRAVKQKSYEEKAKEADEVVEIVETIDEED